MRARCRKKKPPAVFFAKPRGRQMAPWQCGKKPTPPPEAEEEVYRPAVFESHKRPECAADQQWLQDARVEAAVSFTRNGQRMTLGLCDSGTKLRLAAGARRGGWGRIKGLGARRGDLKQGLQEGVSWRASRSWEPAVGSSGLLSTASVLDSGDVVFPGSVTAHRQSPSTLPRPPGHAPTPRQPAPDPKTKPPPLRCPSGGSRTGIFRGMRCRHLHLFMIGSVPARAGSEGGREKR